MKTILKELTVKSEPIDFNKIHIRNDSCYDDLIERDENGFIKSDDEY